MQIYLIELFFFLRNMAGNALWYGMLDGETSIHT